MGKLDKEFYENKIGNFSNFVKAYEDMDSQSLFPKGTSEILNALIKDKGYSDELSQVLRTDTREKSKDDNHTVIGILNKLIDLGEKYEEAKNLNHNPIKFGLERINNVHSNHNKPNEAIPLKVLMGDLPTINDTNKLKKITFNLGSEKKSIDDNMLKSILSVDEDTTNYVDAIANGNTNLKDNYISNIGLLYTFFKNIKLRSDSVKGALRTVKGSFKDDKFSTFSYHDVDEVAINDLDDRKSWLNLTGQIQQIVKGAYVTIPEFRLDKVNFLCYKRNTFDLFIDENRSMQFQFLPHQNPDSIQVNDSYQIICRVKGMIYKNCVVEFSKIAIRKKEDRKSSAFPIVDAYEEFKTIFKQYKEIRDIYLSTNRV